MNARPHHPSRRSSRRSEIVAQAAAAVSACLFLGAAVWLSGCDAQTAQSPRLPVGQVDRDSSGQLVDTSARSFPRADIVFNYSQVFMWKKDSAPDEVADVLESTRQLEETQDRVFTLKQKRRALKARFDAASIDVTELPHQLDELPGKQSQLSEAQAQLETLRAQPASDGVNAQIETLNKKIKRLQNWIDPVLKAQAAVAAAHLETALTEWKSIDGDITQGQEAANNQTVRINDRVWLFNSSPIVFSFHFGADGSVAGGVHNWDLGKIDDAEVAEPGLPVDFAFERVTYEELGGVFTFEAATPSAVYWFKLARTSYNALDGRIHYKGDIVRCSVQGGFGQPEVVHVRDFVQCGVQSDAQGTLPLGQPELRRGAVNLVDLDDNA